MGLRSTLANAWAPQALSATEASERSLLAGRKVLIIVENLPVPFDRRVWQEARALRDAGVQVSVICPVGKGFEAREEVLEGIRIFRHTLPLEAKGPFSFLLEYGAALFHETRLAWKIFFRHGFDTIHACNPPDLIFLVALPFKLLGRRFIFDHHDINPELYEAKFGRRDLFWRLMRLLEWLTFKTADVVISTNESYRAIAVERGGKNPADVFVVRSGPDLARVRSVPPEAGLKNGRKYLVGYVGVMGEQEGIDLLLNAVRHLVKNRGRQDIQFVLVGGGPQLENLKTLARQLDLEAFVTFTGRVPDNLLFQVLSTADVCVNPDRASAMNDKSTMNKIMEYMAFGKPIVQFDLTEGRFSARDASLYARADDVVDFAEKIEELLADEALRARMGEYGRRRVETELAWEHEVPKLIRAYASSAKTKQSRSAVKESASQIPWRPQTLTGLQNAAWRLHRIPGVRVFSRVIEVFIRVVFSAAIPAAARIHRTVHFGHNGLAVVINKACVIDEYAFIGSHVVLGGRTPFRRAPHVCAHAIVHAGAKIIGPVRVGKGAVIGANAVVLTDIPDRAVAVGIPARVVKTDIDYNEYIPLGEAQGA